MYGTAWQTFNGWALLLLLLLLQREALQGTMPLVESALSYIDICQMTPEGSRGGAVRQVRVGRVLWGWCCSCCQAAGVVRGWRAFPGAHTTLPCSLPAPAGRPRGVAQA